MADEVVSVTTRPDARQWVSPVYFVYRSAHFRSFSFAQKVKRRQKMGEKKLFPVGFLGSRAGVGLKEARPVVRRKPMKKEVR